MQPYYPLFALALIWTIFAAIQDLKSREVANWLNYSLIAFALAYRTFYSLQNNNPKFFLLGLSGLIIFTILAHTLYYAKAFAGGDAKLLMGFGIILPYESYSDILPFSLIFILSLFLIGTIWTLLYSIKIAAKNKTKFKKEFIKLFSKYKIIIFISTIIAIITFLASSTPLNILLALIFMIPIIFIYTKTIEKCSIVLLPPSKLTVGDWIKQSLHINKKITIKKTIHGLSAKDIQLLKKYNKKILVEEGIPFVPSFLFTLIIMVYVSLTSKFSLASLLSFLSSLS